MASRRAIRMLAALICVITLAGCAGRADYIGEALNPQADVQSFRVKGEEYRLVSVTTGDAPQMRAIYFVSGSGCSALSTYMETYFQDLPPGYIIYGIDKVGVPRRSIGLSCSRDFWESYALDVLIRRNTVGLSLAQEASTVQIDAIIGVSEGGVIAAIMAADAPEIRSLVMIASGGMTQRRELLTLAQHGGQTEVLQKELAKVDARPNSTSDQALGMTHRYWSSVLDRDPAEFLRRVSQPTLLIIGGEDESVPVASARLADELIPRSELVVIPGASHVFETAKGNQRVKVMSLIDEFLRR
jgi:pimeloyl-ACP methyl ester carboxylesterase